MLILWDLRTLISVAWFLFFSLLCLVSDANHASKIYFSLLHSSSLPFFLAPCTQKHTQQHKTGFTSSLIVVASSRLSAIIKALPDDDVRAGERKREHESWFCRRWVKSSYQKKKSMKKFCVFSHSSRLGLWRTRRSTRVIMTHTKFFVRHSSHIVWNYWHGSSTLVVSCVRNIRQC